MFAAICIVFLVVAVVFSTVLVANVAVRVVSYATAPSWADSPALPAALIAS